MEVSAWRKRVLGLIAASVLAACQPKLAKPPATAMVITREERQKVYQEHRFVKNNNGILLATTFERADGTYQVPQLKEVAAAYPETQQMYADSSARRVVLSISGAAAGAGVGYALGNAIGGGGAIDAQTSDILLYGGLGLLGATIIVAALWHDPMEEFAEIYNAHLGRDLDVEAPAEAPKATEVTLTPTGVTLTF